jgi:hypothetical protein
VHKQQVVQEQSLSQIIDTPTRVTSSTCSIIDNKYVSHPEHVAEINVPLSSMFNCINVMCTNHTHGIHVFVALEEEKTVSDLQILEDYATIIRSDLHKTHGVTVPEVIFLQTLYRWLVPQVSSSR